MYVMFLLVLLQRGSAIRFVWPLEKPTSRKHSDRGALSHHCTKIAFKHRFYYLLRLYLQPPFSSLFAVIAILSLLLHPFVHFLLH